LTLGERKFSGNAQQRKRTHLLHHGTLLHAFDFEPVSRYLKPPPRQPEYRQRRGHADFLTNLPIKAETLEKILREVWQAEEPLTDWPAGEVQRLVEEKYMRGEWTRKR
jgi:lipoate-protein ligase A